MVVYGWKDIEQLAVDVVGAVYRAEQLELRGFAFTFLDAVAATLERSNSWSLAISGGTLYLEVAGQLYEGSVTPIPAGGVESPA